MALLSPDAHLAGPVSDPSAWVEAFAHDVRTPLTVLMTEAHLLRQSAENLPAETPCAVRKRLIESASAIEENAERLAREIRRRTRAALAAPG